MERREFLKGAVVGGVVAVGAALFPHALLAEWPKAAFEGKSDGEALQNLKSLLGATDASDSPDIEIKAPDIAENGAVVPVMVNTTIPNVQSISIIGEKNPIPLVAVFKFPDPAMSVGSVSTRIKMGTTSNVIAVVQAGGKLFKAKKEVKITIGGFDG